MNFFKEKFLRLQLQGIENNEKLCFFKLNAVNPFNGEKISVVFTNYVIIIFGTGAVFGFSAHDKRDFDFAQKFKFKIY